MSSDEAKALAQEITKAIDNLITNIVMAERKACCAAVCDHCRANLPYDPVKKVHNPLMPVRCAAQAIRERMATA